MMYVRYPLSLRNVEDLLAERGIDISHETVRFRWNRFGPMFAAEIRKRRVAHIREIEVETLGNGASVKLRRFGDESFNTREIVFPRWSEVPLHLPTAGWPCFAVRPGGEHSEELPTTALVMMACCYSGDLAVEAVALGARIDRIGP
jgi:hypothetical protein